MGLDDGLSLPSDLPPHLRQALLNLHRQAQSQRTTLFVLDEEMSQSTPIVPATQWRLDRQGEKHAMETKERVMHPNLGPAETIPAGTLVSAWYYQGENLWVISQDYGALLS